MAEQAKKEKAPRTPMPEQKPEVRRRNFDEVPMGYTAEMALAEAQRCMQCKKPSCQQGCPVNVDIPDFIAEIAQGNYAGAIMKLWEKNSLPAVCGRVCPQENQCEGMCILGKKDKPVAIGNLERFTADWARAEKGLPMPPKAPGHRQEGGRGGIGPRQPHRGRRLDPQGPRGHRL